MTNRSDSTAIRDARVADSHFLRRLEWNDSAPKQITKAAGKGDVIRFVLAYRSWLEPYAARFRKRPTFIPLSLISPPTESTALTPLVAEFTQPYEATPRYGLGRAIVGWVQTAANDRLSHSERLIVLEILLNPPIDMEAETWCHLWRMSLPVATEDADDTFDSVEVELAAALVFEPLIANRGDYESAVTRMRDRLLEDTDTDGTPHASAVRRFGRWFTPFVRSGWWGRAFKQSVFAGDSVRRFKDLTARGTEYLRGDGSFVFGDQTQTAQTLLPLAAKLSGWSKRTAIGRVARFKKSEGKTRGKKTLTSSQSDWSESANLRSDRRGTADLLALTYDQPDVNLELCCAGDLVLSGQWKTNLIVGGKAVPANATWSCVCWHSDKDGDYIELVQSRRGVHLTRRVFLSRTSRFALLTDTLRTKKSASIAYQSDIPLADRVMARADFVSREWRLHSGTRSVRAFPVSLPHDRVESAPGNFGVEGDSLVVASSGQQAVTVSVMLDWNPNRADAAAEWTRLTVTESRRVVSSADAAAFRVRVGDYQLLSYHNTSGSPELRAVLGQHTGRETIIGTLDEGGFEPLVLVDPADD